MKAWIKVGFWGCAERRVRGDHAGIGASVSERAMVSDAVAVSGIGENGRCLVWMMCSLGVDCHLVKALFPLSCCCVVSVWFVSSELGKMPEPSLVPNFTYRLPSHHPLLQQRSILSFAARSPNHTLLSKEGVAQHHGGRSSKRRTQVKPWVHLYGGQGDCTVET